MQRNSSSPLVIYFGGKLGGAIAMGASGKELQMTYCFANGVCIKKRSSR